MALYQGPSDPNTVVVGCRLNQDDLFATFEGYHTVMTITFTVTYASVSTNKPRRRRMVATFDPREAKFEAAKQRLAALRKEKAQLDQLLSYSPLETKIRPDDSGSAFIGFLIMKVPGMYTFPQVSIAK